MESKLHGTLIVESDWKGLKYSVQFQHPKKAGKTVKQIIPQSAFKFPIEEAVANMPIIFEKDNLGKNVIAVYKEGYQEERQQKSQTVENIAREHIVRENIVRENISRENIARENQTTRQVSERKEVTRSSPIYKPPLRTNIDMGATAAYNFVQQTCVLPYSSENKELYSGNLVCTITNKTALLVAGASNKLEQDNNERTFFSVQGRPTIPGSSLKGLLRSTVEAITCSQIQIYNNNDIFYRNFRNALYRDKFKNAPQKAGYLIRRHADYYIVNVKYEAVYSRNPQEPQKNKNLDPTKRHIVTGEMRNKKHYYDFDKFPANPDRIHVDDEIMKNFFLQLTPKQEEFLKERYGIEGGEKGIRTMDESQHIPVFYLTGTNDKSIIFFGIAYYFRMRYQNKPKTLVENTTKQNDDTVMDLAMQLFGYAKSNGSLRGKISVSAACFAENVPFKKTQQAILGQPHLSCCAHYLIQEQNQLKSDRISCDVKNMTTFNSDKGRIRGRKFYWHRNEEQQEIAPTISKKVISALTPIAAGASAEFTVRFDHVDLIELGAILEALILPEGHAHKLGMGKALGFGSVRIDLKATAISKTTSCYKNLGERFNLLSEKKQSEIQNELIETARNAFHTWILEAMQNCGIHCTKYEELPHIADFLIMTDFENRPNNDKTKVMDLDKFRNFYVLPTPAEIYPKKK